MCAHCQCALCRLSSLLADFVGSVCVCALSVKLLVSRLFKEVCVCALK